MATRSWDHAHRASVGESTPAAAAVDGARHATSPRPADARFSDHSAPTVPAQPRAVTPEGGVPLDQGGNVTRRRRMQALLATREEGFALDEIQQIFGVGRSRVIKDLRHLQLSLRNEEAVLLMVPPACETCGYTFELEEPKAPGRCPMCKSEKLHDPVFKVDVAES